MTKQTKKIIMNKPFKKMKTPFNILAYLFLLGSFCLFQACADENLLEQTSSSLEIKELTDEIAVESNFEEIDDLAMAAMEHDFGNSEGRTERDLRFECASLTEEQVGETRIVIIDFGDGCEGPHGHIRKGRIIITITGHHWETGSTHVTELVNFYVDDVYIEGTRTTTNISESVESNFKFSMVLSGGKVTWSDELFATREAEHVRTFYRTDNLIGDEMYLEGQVNGVNKDGVIYTGEIVEPLVFTRTCRASDKMPIPISGVKQHTVNEENAIIDFGDGTCDHLATVTKNGETKEIEIKFRRRR